jgi:hypothetical protein
MDDEALADFVRQRASACCEYCGLPQAFSSTRFQIDHIIAEQHGGRTIASNLALACLADNNHKGPNLAGTDPKTGKRAWLFNPRRQKWSRHFRWQGPIPSRLQWPYAIYCARGPSIHQENQKKGHSGFISTATIDVS